MSISTPSGEKKSPGSVKVSGKPAAKPSGKTASAPAKSKGGGPRMPITPVKVGQERNWGPIALFTAVGLIFVAIVGWGVWAAWGPNGASVPWQTKASRIDGIVISKPVCKDPTCHIYGPLQYDTSPPVGGDHTPIWQQCMGNAYDDVIPNEQAVHSLEHGAVWITYRKGLAQDQIDILKGKIAGKGFTLMSPVENLEKPVIVQAWGYQLKLDKADDSRIDDFVNALAKNASQEKGATCGGGTTAIGTTPLTEEQIQAKFGGNQ